MNVEQADLTFNKGVNVLYGINGQGKSAALDAIAFCLADRRRGDSWKDYVRSKHNPFVIDLVVFHLGSEIKFHFVGDVKTGAVQKTVVAKGITYLNSDANIFIRETFDAEMIENVVFTLQDGQPITKLTPLERRNIFKKIFNTNFSTILQELKENSDRIEREVDLRLQKVDFLSGKTYPFVRTSIVDIDRLNKLKEELSEKEKILENQKGYSSLKETAESVKLSLHQLETDEKERKKELSDKEEEALTSKTKYENLQAQYRLRKESYDESLESHREEEQAILSMCTELDRTKEYNKKSIEALETLLLDLKGKLSIKKENLKIHKEGRCLHCGQACDPKNIKTLEEACERIEKEIKENEEQKKKLQDEVASYSLKEKESKDQIRSIEKDLQDTKWALERLGSTVENQKELWGSTQSWVESLRVSVSKPTEQIKTKKAELKRLESELEKYDQETYERTEKQVRELRAEVVSIEKEIDLNKERELLNKKLTQQKEDDEKEIQAHFEEVNDLKKEKEQNTLLRRIFELDFPNFINLKASEMLQEYMNDILEESRKGLSVWLRPTKKGIDFFYKTEESDWMNAKLASGFETAVLTTAFKCAISQAYDSKLLVLDEPDKAATEEASVKLFETLITTINTFDQIFVITHRREAFDYLTENGAHIFEVIKGEFKSLS